MPFISAQERERQRSETKVCFLGMQITKSEPNDNIHACSSRAGPASVNGKYKEAQMNDFNSLTQDDIPWKGSRFPMQCHPIR